MALVDSGGAISIPPQSAPNFQLENYDGKTISLSQLRGRAVVLTFLDPTCYDQCPLFAQEMVATDQLLGKDASKVALVAVVANPITHSVGAAKDFTVTHDLSGFRNWYYLTGSVANLRQVWKDYNVTVSVNSVGMVVHSSQFYFISPNGTEQALMDNTGNDQLAGSYTSVIYKEERALL
jgi:cytochrome oxidase Cu insertion factor (SCO1/SenC/PrrC family)